MTIRITGMNSGLDTEAIITEMMSAYRTKGDKYVKEQTKLSWKQDTWKSLNTKIFNFYKKARTMTLSSGYMSKKSKVSDSTKATVTANNDAVTGIQTLHVDAVAKSGYLTGKQLREADSGSTTLAGLGFTGGLTAFKIRCNGKEANIEVDNNTTIDEFIKKINEATVDKEGKEALGVKASFDAENRRLFIASKETGVNADFSFDTSSSTRVVDVLTALGLNTNDGATKIDGEDAKIRLNGVSYESSSNSFNVNGLNIQTQAVTTEALTITTETDVDGVYEKIKDFLTEYNDLMKEMSGLYNADSAKGYEPLTSDEKSAMSDADIELWEDKVKGALLRRDTTLNGVINAMSGAMLRSYDVNGKSYSLSSFGIMTLGYFEVAKDERGLYHIHGDQDDEDVADKEDKLKKALQDDPDTVISFFQKLSSQLYSNLDDKMKRTELSSIYTVYNDKEMAISYSDYTDTITAWEKKMSEIEDSYYKKFSQMETALAKLQSQTSSLSSLFG